jgi:hypothetical protein
MTGRIAPDTPSRLRNMLGDVDLHQVLFHSSGGNLQAGLEIGRIIRGAGLNTAIGRPVWSTHVNHRDETVYGWVGLEPGECSSACAYAFLGGVRRDLASGRLGFHRFAPDDGGTLPGSGGLIAGQVLSSVIVEYLAEMGVNTRVFRLASGTSINDLYFPSAEEFATLNLSTPSGFGELRLEPFGQGVMAVSTNADPARPSDHFIEVNIFCEFGVPRLYAQSDGNWMAGAEEFGRHSIVVNGQELQTISFIIEGIGERSIFAYEVNPAHLSLIASANSIVMDFYADEASGGQYLAELNLDDQDREVLFAAFNNCVER